MSPVHCTCGHIAQVVAVNGEQMLIACWECARKARRLGKQFIVTAYSETGIATDQNRMVLLDRGMVAN